MKKAIKSAVKRLGCFLLVSCILFQGLVLSACKKKETPPSTYNLTFVNVDGEYAVDFGRYGYQLVGGLRHGFR